MSLIDSTRMLGDLTDADKYLNDNQQALRVGYSKYQENPSRDLELLLTKAFKEFSLGFKDKLSKCDSHVEAYGQKIGKPEIQDKVSQLYKTTFQAPLVTECPDLGETMFQINVFAHHFYHGLKAFIGMNRQDQEKEMGKIWELLKLCQNEALDQLKLEFNNVEQRHSHFKQVGLKVNQLERHLEVIGSPSREDLKDIEGLEWEIHQLGMNVDRCERELKYWKAQLKANPTELILFKHFKSKKPLFKSKKPLSLYIEQKKRSTAKKLLLYKLRCKKMAEGISESLSKTQADLKFAQSELEFLKEVIDTEVSIKNKAIVSEYVVVVHEYVALEESGIEKLFNEIQQKYNALWNKTDDRLKMREDLLKTQMKYGDADLINLHMKKNGDLCKVIENLGKAYQDLLNVSEEDLSMHREMILKLHAELDKLKGSLKCP